MRGRQLDKRDRWEEREGSYVREIVSLHTDRLICRKKAEKERKGKSKKQGGGRQ